MATGPMWAIVANEAGVTGLPEELLVSLGEAACAQGGWDHATARKIASDFLNARGLIDEVPVDDMATAVWLVVVATCRDDVPEEALRAGPP